jgi:HAD superfamily hydrolase (TIGR01509 family)
VNLIEAVLWDMDGVLIDSEHLVQQAFAEVMSTTNYMEDPAQKYLETIGFNRESTVNWYLPYVGSRDIAEGLYSKVHDTYIELSKTQLKLKPGVVEALKAVQYMGIPQMVVTSTKTEVALLKLARFDILSYFEGVLGGDQVSEGKPHPEPYLLGAKRLNVSTRNVLVVEDSENGVKSGVAAGCMVLHMPDLIDTKLEWNNVIYGALDSLESFPKWLASKQLGMWV